MRLHECAREAAGREVRWGAARRERGERREQGKGGRTGHQTAQIGLVVEPDLAVADEEREVEEVFDGLAKAVWVDDEP